MGILATFQTLWLFRLLFKHYGDFGYFLTLVAILATFQTLWLFWLLFNPCGYFGYFLNLLAILATFQTLWLFWLLCKEGKMILSGILGRSCFHTVLYSRASKRVKAEAVSEEAVAGLVAAASKANAPRAAASNNQGRSLSSF